MKRFDQFGIKPETKSFVGDKIKISRVLDREITVMNYRITDSKYQDKTEKCLHMQIELNGEKHVIFTGSGVLMDMIQQVPREEFPFIAKIIKDNDRFEFA
jgi:hypothetical protein